MRKRRKVTINEVAQHAGVSSATVSYVVNGKKKVSEKTKVHVLETIEKLGYKPDLTAVSLSTQRSNIIGVMVVNEDLSSVLKTNYYYSELLGGMESVFKDKYDILISGFRDPLDCKAWIGSRNLEGLIVLGILPESYYEYIQADNIPILTIDTYTDMKGSFHRILINDELGGYLATKHLIDNGHENIVFIGFDLLGEVDLKRAKGYKTALNEAGLPIKEQHILNSGGANFEAGVNVAKDIENMDSEITAIFATSDILALGIMKYFHDNNKKIPQDYSLVGFDDIEMSRYSSPSLTTVKQDVFKKGVVAGQVMVDAILGTIENQTVTNLPVKLVVRGSTRNISE